MPPNGLAPVGGVIHHEEPDFFNRVHPCGQVPGQHIGLAGAGSETGQHAHAAVLGQ